MSLARRALLLPLPRVGGPPAGRGGLGAPVARFHVSSHNNLKYGFLAYLLGDRPLKRFHKYSKIITVDGNLRVGKGKLAQQIAEQLGMRYFPEADVHYADRAVGLDTNVDQLFTGDCSLKAFYDDPKSPNGNSYRLQAFLYGSRLLQYADALEHLFSTGQGVVLERSPYSDYVFLEAMFQQGYIHKRCVDHYKKMKEYSLYDFLPPHLVIYIDEPVSEVLKRITAKGEPYEKKVSPAYLQSIEDVYKKRFLSWVSVVAEMLQYTAREAEDVEKVLEDIDFLKFDKGPWLEETDGTIHKLRLLVQDKMTVMVPASLPFHIPELTTSGTLGLKMYEAWKMYPGHHYAPGYNEDVGDKWIWLK